MLAAGLIALGGTGLGLMLKDLLRQPETVDEVAHAGQLLRAGISSLRSHGDIEPLAPGTLIPEEERTGSDILMGVGDTLVWSIEERTDLLNKLQPGTNLRLLATQNSHIWNDIFSAKFPHLTVSTYRIPGSPGAFQYAQDSVFGTGSKDASGRLQVGIGVFDHFFCEFSQRLNEQIFAQNYDPATTSPEEFEFMRSDLDHFTDINSYRFLGDESLIAYSDDFVGIPVPLLCAGGDMRTIRLPNGGVGLVIGKETYANLLMIFASIVNDIKGNSDALQTTLPFDQFDHFLKELKELYKEYLGVDEVIILDEGYVLERASANREVDLVEVGRGSAFFHNDMLVKFSTTPAGGNVAFCTDLMQTRQYNEFFINPGDEYLIERVPEQLRALGFEVRPLPCGPIPALNYANALIFSPAPGSKVAMVPQYGMIEDDYALEVYQAQDLGLEVIPVDMSYLNNPEDGLAHRTGSVHCNFAVLS